ncbi:MAG TPA: flavodoxin [Patescibacteria group bacterium]|nr:flavodoxin [Patescibacteria group bacterium]
MNKIMILVLYLLLTLSLTACGTANNAANNDGEKNSNANASQEQKNAVAGQNASNSVISKAQAQPLSSSKKILVAYFSHSGNTRELANQIQANIGGELFEIVTVDPYPEDYEAVKDRAQQELSGKIQPRLKTKVANMESYDVVFVGYPIWWGTMPMPVSKFLSEYNLAGKTVIPFCTHEGSQFGRSIADVTKLCPQSTILNGVAIRGRDVKNSQSEVAEWLSKLNL